MGTRFVATHASAGARQREASRSSPTPSATRRSSSARFGNAARVARNSVSEEIYTIGRRPGATYSEAAPLASGARGRLRRGPHEGRHGGGPVVGRPSAGPGRRHSPCRRAGRTDRQPRRPGWCLTDLPAPARDRPDRRGRCRPAAGSRSTVPSQERRAPPDVGSPSTATRAVLLMALVGASALPDVGGADRHPGPEGAAVRHHDDGAAPQRRRPRRRRRPPAPGRRGRSRRRASVASRSPSTQARALARYCSIAARSARPSRSPASTSWRPARTRTSRPSSRASGAAVSWVRRSGDAYRASTGPADLREEGRRQRRSLLSPEIRQRRTWCRRVQGVGHVGARLRVTHEPDLQGVSVVLSAGGLAPRLRDRTFVGETIDTLTVTLACVLKLCYECCSYFRTTPFKPTRGGEGHQYWRPSVRGMRHPLTFAVYELCDTGVQVTTKKGRVGVYSSRRRLDLRGEVPRGQAHVRVDRRWPP